MLGPVSTEFLSQLKNPETNTFRDQVVLYGVEAHVCIKQTCFDLLNRGYGVHLVIDGISSICPHDRNIGIESMKLAGA